MFSRQKILVSILHEVGGAADRIQLMKWAFLLAVETPSRGGNAYYRFVPYLYGPYSFSLYREIDSLVRDGIFAGENGHVRWNLTDVAKDAILSLPVKVKKDLRYVISEYGTMTSRELINTIYERYPWYTVNCENTNKRRERRPVAETAVYTIGYEGLSIDDFLNRLMRQGVQCVIDVRNNPISRRYGFHKSTLARLCGFLDIEYFHFPELGIPSAEREALVVKDDYEELFANYSQTRLPAQTTTLKDVTHILQTYPSALVCMEADPAYCHRTHLAQALSSLSNLPIIHLEWPR